MKMLAFSKRNAKEILRDPINLFFGLGFPLVLLALLIAIQSNIPVKIFELEHLTTGITVFGLSFFSLFAATLVAKDRESAFLARLYTTPMTPIDFILGYIFSLLPLAFLQTVICYLFAAILGLKIKIGIIYALLFILPTALFFISLGLLCGSIMGSRQVGGICGALLTNVSALLSGIWFDVELIGGVIAKIASLLPFIHAVELERAAFNGRLSAIFPHLWWVLGYTAVTLLLSVLLFLKQMKK